MHNIYTSLTKEFVDERTGFFQQAGWTEDMIGKFLSWCNENPNR